MLTPQTTVPRASIGASERSCVEIRWRACRVTRSSQQVPEVASRAQPLDALLPRHFGHGLHPLILLRSWWGDIAGGKPNVVV